MNEQYNYSEALMRFHSKAASKSGFRGNIGNLYSAMIAVAMSNKVATLETKFAFWHEFTRIGKEEFYKAIKWLHENNFITYEEGVAQVKGRITLHLSKTAQVGDQTYKDTNRDTDTATHNPTDNHTNEPTDSTPIPSRTHTRGSSNNKKNNINSSSSNEDRGVGKGEGEEGGRVIKFPSLQSLVEQYKSDPTNEVYPNGFYSGFLNYYESVSNKDPNKKTWEVLCKMFDKSLWLKRELESYWSQYGYRYQSPQERLVANGPAYDPLAPIDLPDFMRAT